MTSREGRRFAFTLAIAFLVFGGIAWWRGHSTVAPILAVAGLVLGTAGTLVPQRLGPIFRAWMGFAAVLSRITTPVFLGIVYFLVIAPIGIVMRLFGRNPIDHQPSDDSYWMQRPPRGGDMERQF